MQDRQDQGNLPPETLGFGAHVQLDSLQLIPPLPAAVSGELKGPASVDGLLQPPGGIGECRPMRHPAAGLGADAPKIRYQSLFLEDTAEDRQADLITQKYLPTTAGTERERSARPTSYNRLLDGLDGCGDDIDSRASLSSFGFGLQASLMMTVPVLAQHSGAGHSARYESPHSPL